MDKCNCLSHIVLAGIFSMMRNNCDKLITITIEMIDLQGVVFCGEMEFVSEEGANLREDLTLMWMFAALDSFKESDLHISIVDIDKENPRYITQSISCKTDLVCEGVNPVNFNSWFPIDFKPVYLNGLN